jgi:hypothetical protein
VSDHAATAPPLLYVANAGDGTITRLDARTGRVAGPPLPAGPVPDQVVPGTGGRLLVGSLSPSRSGVLTLVAAVGRERSPTLTGATGTTGTTGVSWMVRSVPLEPGAREVWLAGEGGRQAVVAYRAPDPATGRLRCRLALVDTWSGTVQAPHTIWAAPDHLTALAFDGGPGGPVAYLGMWQSGQQLGVPTAVPAAVSTTVPTDADASGDGDWLLAVHATTGTVAAAQRLASAPLGLSLAPAPDRSGVRLYYLEMLSAPEAASLGAARGRLRGLNPTTLAVESEYALDAGGVGLAMAPDGEDAYVLTADGYALTQLQLTTATQHRLVALPERGVSLAVTGERVYVVNPWGNEVWAVDRRPGQPLRRIPVGRGPVRISRDRAA